MDEKTKDEIIQTKQGERRGKKKRKIKKEEENNEKNNKGEMKYNKDEER